MTTIALMTKRSRKPATYQEIIDLPENMVGEIIDGELIVSPRPAVGHALAASVLGSQLGGPFHWGSGGPGGWWILDEVELHLGSDILVPDLAGWRRSRMPKLPAPSEPFITLAPDWVCEMLSSSTAQIDRVRKLRIYARKGPSRLAGRPFVANAGDLSGLRERVALDGCLHGGRASARRTL